MVKRVAIIFPDGSLNVMSSIEGEAAATAQARREAAAYNKGERDASKRAYFGVLDVDLTGFREKF